jgi:hypothetical protein
MTTKLDKALEAERAAIRAERGARRELAQAKGARARRAAKAGFENAHRARLDAAKVRRRAARLEPAAPTTRGGGGLDGAVRELQEALPGAVVERVGPSKVAVRIPVQPAEPLAPGEIRISCGPIRISAEDGAAAGKLVAQLVGMFMPEVAR